ncbi:MAG: MmcB family DNA repair protein [Sphingomonadales bacterium]|nr:MmcB family DNA repair protein [Sphingomonadales bacterium]MBP7134805.1 MmcB family DNA repair protein [Sphingomonadaceae bacterium]MBK6721126.1 MmcB family DNA repair protein [Sphingomonadales bacterium]MBK8272591.1 MmcB family DNA repair protein [Sphingomonadales bacterium]MBK8861947.1 MmcB family DNA repair protein [Sphingomonadales bacterium]
MEPADYGPDERVVAGDVARGVTRLFLRHDLLSISEVPLGNGRRADLFALSPKGLVTIVEIKVSKADLLGDGKWPEYLDYCDRYFWAVPQGFDLSLMERPALMPERTGLIVADRYDAAILREAQSTMLAPARRKVETLRFARRAARRLLVSIEAEDETAF